MEKILTFILSSFFSADATKFLKNSKFFFAHETLKNHLKSC